MSYKDKEKNREYNLAWRKAHPEYFKDYCKKRYYENQEREKERVRKYFQDRPGYSSERAKAWRANNPSAASIHGKKYYSENREAELARKKEYGKNNPVHTRKAYLKKVYGITPEYYENMFVEQSGRCAICGRHQSELKKELCIDHNHETGNIRGLLCDQCNKGLGHFRDNPIVLDSAKLYLLSRDE